MAIFLCVLLISEILGQGDPDRCSDDNDDFVTPNISVTPEDKDRSSLDCNTQTNKKYCEDGTCFMTSIEFSYPASNKLYFVESKCVTTWCSNCALSMFLTWNNVQNSQNGKSVYHSSFDIVERGVECKHPTRRLNKSTVTCGGVGTGGWNVEKEDCVCKPGLDYNSSTDACETVCSEGAVYNTSSGQCELCKPGTYYEDETCVECPAGKVTKTGGATECSICPRGSVPTPLSDGCAPCPSGYTTYKYTLNECEGPKLWGLKKDETFRVEHRDLGNLNNKISRWKSMGDWSLSKTSQHGTAGMAIIREKYTTKRRRPRTIRVRKVIKSVQPQVNDMYCFTDNGASYRGYKNRGASGNICKGGKKCRNADNYKAEPYCTTRQGWEECGIPKCHHQSTNVPGKCTYTASTATAARLEYVHTTLETDLDDAQHVCDRLGKECIGVTEAHSGSWRLISTQSNSGGTGFGLVNIKLKDWKCNPYAEEYFQQTY